MKKSLYTIILDPPLAPSVTYEIEHVINDTFLFSFNWSRPFTWPGFPITNYTITLRNYSSGEPVDETFTIIPANESGLEEPTQGYQLTTEGDTCYQFKISVKGSNRLGEGEYSSITVGHPITSEFLYAYS